MIRVLNNLQATDDALSMDQRGDMIKTYKILCGKYDLAAIPNLTRPTSLNVTTRGNDLRLQKNRARYDLRIFY